MSALDWVLLAVLAAWIVGSILWMRHRRKKGKCIGCSGDCGSCPYQTGIGNE